MESEFAYPPRWGKTVLSIDEDPYNECFDADFDARFIRREHEYQTPPASRVYCRHIIEDNDETPKKGEEAPEVVDVVAPYMDQNGVPGTVAKKLALSVDEQKKVEAKGGKLMECGMMASDWWGGANCPATCYRCLGWVCHGCGLPVHDSTELKQHVCTKQDTRREDVGKAGFILGKDVQLCPGANCGSPPVALEDGCSCIPSVCLRRLLTFL